MQMSLFSCRRFPALTYVFLFAMAAGLLACSSKNPLMTEPSTKPAAEAVVTTPAKSVTNTPASTVATPPAPDSAASATPVSTPTSSPAQNVQTPTTKPATEAVVTPPAKTPENTPDPVAATPPVADSAARPAPVSASTSSPTLNAPAPTGARRWLGVFSPYKIDIQQGNFISQEDAAKLKEGMTKEQVRFVLGVPLLTDMFHDGRWDYLFRLQKGNGEISMNRLTVFFKENRVIRFESTKLPGEVEYISHISGTPAKQSNEKPKVTPEAKPETKSDVSPETK
jgi:outer membrane protein assembly factor BamE